MAINTPKTRPVGAHVIVPGGNIVNQSPQENAINPHECHMFVHQLLYTINPMGGSVNIDGWKMSGEVPLDLSITPIGTITGTIKLFNDQPFITDINSKETIALDGSNWNKVGRPESFTYTYQWEVWAEYIWTNPDGVPKPFMSSPAIVTLMVIKSNTIDDYAALKAYLAPGTSKVSTAKGEVDVDHRFDIKGTKYYFKDFEAFKAADPGPWPLCGDDRF